MQTKAMKRTVVALAAAFFAVSTSAFAEAGKPVALSEAQLDQVTAAGAMSSVTVFNPGKAKLERSNRSGYHSTCVNCLEMDTPAAATGATVVITPKGKMVVNLIRPMP